MPLLPTFHPGFMNAWWLVLPLVLPMAYLGVTKKEVARRLADMTGYARRERIWTVVASLAPYPLMIATIWTPFTTLKSFLAGGALLYAVGVIIYLAALRAFATTQAGSLCMIGPYRMSRNPIYVGATLMFLGIGLMTLNLLLLIWLALSLLPQHLMILAEERLCRERFGADYERYWAEVPRYLR
jgi:protein-S-isoprenylcysteine O-methyltransferase Ste14